MANNENNENMSKKEGIGGSNHDHRDMAANVVENGIESDEGLDNFFGSLL